MTSSFNISHMALHLISLPHQCSLVHNLRRYVSHRTLQGTHRNGHCLCLATTQITELAAERRSANYQPTIWNHELVNSLKNDYADETCKERAKTLEEEVRFMVDNADARSSALLELIDDIERLGLGHRFEMDISRALDRISSSEGSKVGAQHSVQATALRFRLLRQHGYEISTDVFNSFRDHNGDFMTSPPNDVKGLLSLYEASYLGFEGENILDEAKSFTSMHLRDLKGNLDAGLREQVNHALELPLHRRMIRSEARRYIDAYSKREDANYLLLELAKLDFNMVQSTFQKDLQDASRWWTAMGLASKLSFIRDRLMECFLWTVGMVSEPQFNTCRKGLTKVTALITTIDDVYDVHGYLDELELFTHAVERWDVSAVKILPDYMKICFLALYNTVNEMAYDALKEQGENTIPILTKAWADLCQAFLVEAKWNYQKYTPTLEAYLDNAWRSVSGVVILVHAYLLMSQDITKEALECLEKYHDLLRWSSMIFRLCNDLGTSTGELERGETANSILCYMRETGVSEEIAREHIRNLIDETWKKMNKVGVTYSPFAKSFIETATNLARISHCTYQYGDEHGDPDDRAKNRVLSLIIQPITLMEEARGNKDELC